MLVALDIIRFACISYLFALWRKDRVERLGWGARMTESEKC